MIKPIFERRKGRPPELQIKILKTIVISGQVSKKKIAELLLANYSDVSDSIDALKRSKLLVISEKRHTGRNPEIFYKMTERGLRALLNVKLNDDEFWRAIILLCIFSKEPLDEAEFENYFQKFQHKTLGLSYTKGHFFLVPLFDRVLKTWLEVNGKCYSIPISQKVIEYLAINGPSTIQNIARGITTSEEDLLDILNIDSVQPNTPLKSNLQNGGMRTYSDSNANSDSVLQLLISATETNKGLIYELTLFGILVVIATVTYSFARKMMSRDPANIKSKSVSCRGSELLYSNIDLKNYIDKIALNYKTKLPLIFGKWDFLKSYLGIMLYDGFDFLIYTQHRHRTIDETIWFSGTREFYDDIKMLTYTAISKLRPMYVDGTAIIKGFKNRQSWIEGSSRIIPVQNKLLEIGEILKYAEVTPLLGEIQNVCLSEKLFQGKLLNNIYGKYIESLFGDELTFLYYLSLNSDLLTKSYNQPTVRTTAKSGNVVIPYETKEALQLGGPRGRLMAILANDRDIKDWYSMWIESIIEYRRQTLGRMSELYDQILNANKNFNESKYDYNTSRKAEMTVLYEESDITKICSGNYDSFYEYSNL